MSLQLEGIIQKLIQLRIEAGLSQTHLAAIIGVQASTINHFETRSRPSVLVSTLERYAAALGCTIKMEVLKDGHEVQLRDSNRTREDLEGAPGV